MGESGRYGEWKDNAMAGMSRCSHCDDIGDYQLAGVLFCAHCALQFLILALEAEVSLQRIRSESVSEVLVDH
jgi:hypothetical protein